MTEVKQSLVKIWQRFYRLPAGPWLFSQILKWKVPYSGSIGAQVIELRPGYARLVLADRKKVRNHLNSIHAIALTNLGELTSGLALNALLPSDVQGIVVEVTTQYLKKARGPLSCESEVSLPDISDTITTNVQAIIKDREGDIVSTTIVSWRLSPIE